MYTWKNLKKDGYPKQDILCLVSFPGRSQIKMAIYNSCYKTFELDDPSSRYALYPLDIEYYMEYSFPGGNNEN